MPARRGLRGQHRRRPERAPGPRQPGGCSLSSSAAAARRPPPPGSKAGPLVEDLARLRPSSENKNSRGWPGAPQHLNSPGASPVIIGRGPGAVEPLGCWFFFSAFFAGLTEATIPRALVAQRLAPVRRRRRRRRLRAVARRRSIRSRVVAEGRHEVRQHRVDAARQGPGSQLEGPQLKRRLAVAVLGAPRVVAPAEPRLQP